MSIDQRNDTDDLKEDCSNSRALAIGILQSALH